MKKFFMFITPLVMIILSVVVSKLLKYALIIAAIYMFYKLIKESVHWW